MTMSKTSAAESIMSKVLIVTGGGRGIGKATCLLAAERGWDVCVNYASDAAAAEKVKQQIEAKGRKAIAVKADIGKESDVVALFKAADALGPLKGLVNNAGFGMRGSLQRVRVGQPHRRALAFVQFGRAHDQGQHLRGAGAFAGDAAVHAQHPLAVTADDTGQ